jgi:hypothetical protein
MKKFVGIRGVKYEWESNYLFTKKSERRHSISVSQEFSTSTNFENGYGPISFDTSQDIEQWFPDIYYKVSSGMRRNAVVTTGFNLIKFWQSDKLPP